MLRGLKADSHILLAKPSYQMRRQKRVVLLLVTMLVAVVMTCAMMMADAICATLASLCFQTSACWKPDCFLDLFNFNRSEGFVIVAEARAPRGVENAADTTLPLYVVVAKDLAALQQCLILAPAKAPAIVAETNASVVAAVMVKVVMFVFHHRGGWLRVLEGD